MAARDRGLVGRVKGFIAAGPERAYTGSSMRRTGSRFGRRSFLQGGLALASIGVAAGCGQASPPWQRPAKVPRVGILPLTTPASGASLLDAFRGGLRDLGYVEGQTIILEPRFSEGQVERYPELVAELMRLDVSVIVVQDSTARRSTS